MLLLPVVLAERASSPTAVLLLPVVLLLRTPSPTAVLPLPVVLICDGVGPDGGVAAARGVAAPGRRPRRRCCRCPWCCSAARRPPRRVGARRLLLHIGGGKHPGGDGGRALTELLHKRATAEPAGGPVGAGEGLRGDWPQCHAERQGEHECHDHAHRCHEGLLRQDLGGAWPPPVPGWWPRASYKRTADFWRDSGGGGGCEHGGRARSLLRNRTTGNAGRGGSNEEEGPRAGGRLRRSTTQSRDPPAGAVTRDGQPERLSGVSQFTAPIAGA